MYTLGAALGALVVYALLRAVQANDGLPGSPPGAKASGLRSGSLLKQADNPRSKIANRKSQIWWTFYALAAAAGMYTLYYFVFLLIPVNLWALWRVMTKDEGRRTKKAARITHHASRIRLWFRANLLAFALYLPWLLIAIRQALDPPVPPWRTPPAPLAAVIESWNALALGQSAPTWLWPVLALTLGVYLCGLIALRRGFERGTAALLFLATFGPLALILLLSLVTPLYHVRYLFTTSPAFYVVAAAGLVWIWDQRRLAAAVIAGCWLIAAAVTLVAFWFDPLYRADDHRAAVRDLAEPLAARRCRAGERGLRLPAALHVLERPDRSTQPPDRAAAAAARGWRARRRHHRACGRCGRFGPRVGLGRSALGLLRPAGRGRRAATGRPLRRVPACLALPDL